VVTAVLVEALVEELEKVPPSRGAALKVVQMVDDASVGSAEVAATVGSDPALTARILQVANSAYYGLSGRVRTTSFAVTVVGFQTVRSLAALAAAGVQRGDELPKGFWRLSAAAATGAGLLAQRVGASPADAFCAGMLHDLGTVLLWRRDPELHDALVRRASAEQPLTSLEQRAYGGTHATLCGDVLSAWCVPEDLCTAISRHHDQPSPTAMPLRRALQAGVAIGSLLDGVRDPWVQAALDAASVRRDELPALVSQVQEARDQLAAVLSS
jgi:HD-like signal output (HDOD) protein